MNKNDIYNMYKMYKMYGIIVLIILIYILYIKYNNIERYENNCKINIIIPIKNREVELEDFIINIEPLFKNLNINYRIYIIEQKNGIKFNRGKLLNIGFIEANKDKFANYYYFTDCDIYPLNFTEFKINCYDEIVHLYGNENNLGGVMIINKENYELINGHSNNYSGWGLEDNNIMDRALILGAKINNSNLIKRYTNNNIYDKKSPEDYQIKKKEMYNKNKKQYDIDKRLYTENKDNIYKDGIKNCNYKIITKMSYKDKPYINRYLVEI